MAGAVRVRPEHGALRVRARRRPAALLADAVRPTAAGTAVAHPATVGRPRHRHRTQTRVSVSLSPTSGPDLVWNRFSCFFLSPVQLLARGGAGGERPRPGDQGARAQRHVAAGAPTADSGSGASPADTPVYATRMMTSFVAGQRSRSRPAVAPDSTPAPGRSTLDASLNLIDRYSILLGFPSL